MATNKDSGQIPPEKKLWEQPPAKHEDCCPENPSGGDPTNCIEKWEEEKIKIKNQLTELVAVKNQFYNAYLSAQAWEAKVKTYWENIKRTDELAEEVHSELEAFYGFVVKVCTNAECTVEAIQLLFNYLNDLYNALLDMRDNLDGDPLCCKIGLNDRLDQIEDPGLPKDSGIRKCLLDFSAKLDAVISMQQIAFENVLAALKCANLLRAFICEPDNGLIKDLDDLLKCFGQEVSDEKPEELDPSIPFVEEVQCCIDFAHPPKFPIWYGKYYNDTWLHYEHKYQGAKWVKDAEKEKWEGKRDEYDALKACYDSLCQAIETAKAAKTAK